MLRMILVLVLGVVFSALALSENSKVEALTDTEGQPTYSMLNERAAAEVEANAKRLREKKPENSEVKEETPAYQPTVSPK